MAKGTTAKDLRTKSGDELIELVATTKNKLFQSRFENYTNRLNDTAQVRKLRRDLARMNTIVSERRISAAKPNAGKAKSEG